MNEWPCKGSNEQGELGGACEQDIGFLRRQKLHCLPGFYQIFLPSPIQRTISGHAPETDYFKVKRVAIDPPKVLQCRLSTWVNYQGDKSEGWERT